MSNLKLSHSAATRFQTCAKSYEYHYLNRLRPKVQSAALLFGSAVDAAIGAMLLKNGKDPYKIFDFLWNYSEINGVSTYLPTCTAIAYSNTDADYDLITEENRAKLAATYDDDYRKQINQILDKKEQYGFKNLSDQEKTLLNNYNWYSLHRKGHLMIEAYQTKVMPRIQEVLAVQQEVNMTNSNGDSIIGYVDLVAKFYDYGPPIIFDNKTSSIDYKSDSVLTSTQLALYVHGLSEQYDNTKTAGFIVMKKRINKNKVKVCSKCQWDGTGQRHKTCDQVVDKARCDGAWIETFKPECDIQIVIDEISEHSQQIVVENFDQINQLIKTGVFMRNFNSCVMPYGKCDFYDKCHSNVDDNLQVVESKPK